MIFKVMMNFFNKNIKICLNFNKNQGLKQILVNNYNKKMINSLNLNN